MPTELFRLALSQGIWAVLSISLIFYILKIQEKRDQKQEEREANYQKLITDLTEKFGILQMVKDDLEDIKKNFEGKKIKVF